MKGKPPRAWPEQRDLERPATSAAEAMHTAAAAMDLTLPLAAVERLVRFLDVLLVWRRRTSLVSQRSAAEIIDKHFRDSFAIPPLLQPGWRIADLGSGAGFPGLVAAIVRPDVRVALVESKQRKTSFLGAAIRAAEATNAEVIGARVEDLVLQGSLAGAFDAVVSRAVWGLKDFLIEARPLLRSCGLAISMQSAPAACQRMDADQRHLSVDPALGTTGEAPSGEMAVGSAPEITVAGYSGCEIRHYRLRRGEKRQLVIARRCST